MLDILLQAFNSSKLFNGISTLGMHIGGRYITSEIPKNVENVFNQPFFRRIFIFLIIFLAFRDIKWAILITLIFIISFNYILNSKSRMYIGKFFGYVQENEEEKNQQNNIITVDDLEKAKKVIKTYNETLEKQKIYF
jgi:hypothetical protein